MKEVQSHHHYHCDSSLHHGPFAVLLIAVLLLHFVVPAEVEAVVAADVDWVSRKTPFAELVVG